MIGIWDELKELGLCLKKFMIVMIITTYSYVLPSEKTMQVNAFLVVA